MSRDKSAPWRVSLHGGHSSAFCDHAGSTLRDIVEAAIAFGYHTFGIAEHAPRVEAHRLYAEEIEMGWDIATLDRLFAEYAATLDALLTEYAGRITLLKGFEAEVVPEDRYAEVMLGYRERYGFEYLVGSVHWAGGFIIDYTREQFERAVAAYGGLEGLALRYYETVADMVCRLKPEVVAHIDLIRKYAPDEASVSTPAVRRAAITSLEAIRAHNAILDVNTSAFRNGLACPYPAPWLVEAAQALDVPCCFGDDSHHAGHVGAGIEQAREYLLELGVETITVLAREEDGLRRERIPLR